MAKKARGREKEKYTRGHGGGGARFLRFVFIALMFCAARCGAQTAILNSQNFDSCFSFTSTGSLIITCASGWSYEQVVGYGRVRSGIVSRNRGYGLLLDSAGPSSSPSENRLIWSVDFTTYGLSGSRIQLEWWQACFQDENDPFDGVFVRLRSEPSTWVLLTPFSPCTFNFDNTPRWIFQSVNFSGFDPSEITGIAFQQVDNVEYPTDGRAFDDIVIRENFCTLPAQGQGVIGLGRTQLDSPCVFDRPLDPGSTCMASCSAGFRETGVIVEYQCLQAGLLSPGSPVSCTVAPPAITAGSSDDPNTPNNRGAILAGVLVPLVVIAVVIVAVMYYRKRRGSTSDSSSDSNPLPSNEQPAQLESINEDSGSLLGDDAL